MDIISLEVEWHESDSESNRWKSRITIYEVSIPGTKFFEMNSFSLQREQGTEILLDIGKENYCHKRTWLFYLNSVPICFAPNPLCCFLLLILER